jgi:hypothetical protein
MKLALFFASLCLFSTLAHADPITGSAVVGGIAYGGMAGGTSAAANVADSADANERNRKVMDVCHGLSPADADYLTSVQVVLFDYARVVNGNHLKTTAIVKANEIISKVRNQQAPVSDEQFEENLSIAASCVGF